MRIIDADELINQKPFTAVGVDVNAYEEGFLDCVEAAREAIQNAPTIDPKDLRPHGGCKWCRGRDYNTVLKATATMFFHSNGGMSIQKIDVYYCPHCGTKLKGKGNIFVEQEKSIVIYSERSGRE